MNTLLTATALFSLLLSHARSPSGVDGDRLVSKYELQNALVSLEIDGDGITRQEASFVRAKLFQVRRVLKPEAQAEADRWLIITAAGKPAPAKQIRRNHAFQATLSWLAFARGSTGLTPLDARLLLTILKTPPSPIRVIEVHEWTTRTALIPATKKVFDNWIKRHRSRPRTGDLAASLPRALDGLLWLSESDRPVYPITFAKLPVWPLSNSQLRQLLGEPSTVTVDRVPLVQLFAWIEPALSSTNPTERALAKRFDKLRKLLAANLTNITAFKIGTIERDLLIVGRAKDGTICGIVTQVVET